MKTVQVEGFQQGVQVGTIYCLGRNYREHVREMRAEIPPMPVIFIKPASALIGDRDPITIPSFSREMHHEVELVIAIGTGGKSIRAEAASRHILGYAVGLDMTLRDIQTEAKNKGLPWSVAKGFESSAPVSQIIPKERIRDAADLVIRCRVNGIIRQQSSTREMIHPVPRIIEYVSSIFPLEAGDLIFTGTPEGVGPVRSGDTVEAELAGYARTTHTVRCA